MRRCLLLVLILKNKKQRQETNKGKGMNKEKEMNKEKGNRQQKKGQRTGKGTKNRKGGKGHDKIRKPKQDSETKLDSGNNTKFWKQTKSPARPKGCRG